MMEYAKGQRVVVKPTPSGIRESYPAANWIEAPTTVTLLEGCEKGALDVVDVELKDGTQDSVYAFSIDRIVI